VNAIDKKKKMPLNYVESILANKPGSSNHKKIKEFLISKGAENDWRGAYKEDEDK
jgi:hypothetical protein